MGVRVLPALYGSYAHAKALITNSMLMQVFLNLFQENSVNVTTFSKSCRVSPSNKSWISWMQLLKNSSNVSEIMDVELLYMWQHWEYFYMYLAKFR